MATTTAITQRLTRGFRGVIEETSSPVAASDLFSITPAIGAFAETRFCWTMVSSPTV
jgi:hypothetical protein